MTTKEQKRADKAFAKKTKQYEKNLREAYVKRKKELPSIIEILQSQKELLSIRERLVSVAPPLHDIIQNLSVYVPEIMAKELIAPCIVLNDYALAKYKKVDKKNAELQLDVILTQKKRLNEINTYVEKGEDVIHSFTEIVDNLQALCPEKFLELADMLNSMNDKALEHMLQIQQNYNN